MRALIVAFLTFSTFLTGCASKDIVIQPGAPVTFAPKYEKRGEYSFVIPSNFKLIEAESLVYDNGEIYRAFLVYKGEGFIQDIVKFLDINYEKSGWKKEPSVVGRDAVLAYSKDGQMIIIKIDYGVTNTYLRVILTKY